MKPSSIVKWIFIIFLVGVLVGASVGLYMFFKPARDIASSKAEYFLSASDLTSEFLENEDAANQKYLSAAGGRIIEVSGVIREIVLADSTNTFIVLADSTMLFGGVNCYIDSQNVAALGSIVVGERATFKGECSGFIGLTEEVILTKCVRVNH